MTKMTALFAELATLDRQMATESSKFSINELTKIDDRHSQVWAEIIAFRPANKELAELMVLMLLDKMQAMAARGENCMLVREKLLELFGENYSTPRQYMPVFKGSGSDTAHA